MAPPSLETITISQISSIVPNKLEEHAATAFRQRYRWVSVSQSIDELVEANKMPQNLRALTNGPRLLNRAKGLISPRRVTRKQNDPTQ